MSNPYDPGPPPGGHPDPYDPGAPFADSYRLNPYATQGSGPASLDGVSIAALVCSLTCCAAPVGIGLGIAGIVRTSEGKRTGRWAAVTGVVVGIIGTLVLVAAGIGAVWLGTNVVLFEDARPGDCVDIDDEGSDGVEVWKADCEESHDAEIVAADRFDAALLKAYQDDPLFCEPLATANRYGTVVRAGSHLIESIVESYDADEPELGDWFLCVASSTSGDPLDSPLQRDAASSSGEEADDAVENSDEGRRINSQDLEVGDCFDEPGRSGDQVGAVLVKPCKGPHEFEAIGRVQLSGSEYPGEKAIAKRADACLTKFERYLDIAYDDSRFELGYYSPTEESWKLDKDRTILCLGEHPDGKDLHRSLKGISR